jgi:hypothetical protein
LRLSPWRARLELEADLAVGLLDEEGLELRPFFETKPVSRSVRPVASSFFICSRSIGCCRIMRPERKSQVRPADRLFAEIGHAVLEHAAPHFGQVPSGSWPLKSGASSPPPCLAEVELGRISSLRRRPRRTAAHAGCGSR